MEEHEMLYVCEGLGYVYPDGTIALKNVSFRIPRGKITAILGSNGSGKTTLLLLLAGLLRPTKGKIIYKNRDLAEYKGIRREISVVFQSPEDQLLTASVFDEIAFGPRQLDISIEKMSEVVSDIANMMGIASLLTKPPYRISGGEKKKVALASAIAINPEVLLIDEPFSELSYNSSIIVKDLIRRRKVSGNTIIYTWHDTNIVTELADYVVLIKNGTILSTGTPREILTDEKLILEAGLNLPFALQVYKKLNGSINRGSPLSIDELLRSLHGRSE